MEYQASQFLAIDILQTLSCDHRSSVVGKLKLCPFTFSSLAWLPTQLYVSYAIAEGLYIGRQDSTFLNQGLHLLQGRLPLLIASSLLLNPIRFLGSILFACPQSGR